MVKNSLSIIRPHGVLSTPTEPKVIRCQSVLIPGPAAFEGRFSHVKYSFVSLTEAQEIGNYEMKLHCAGTGPYSGHLEDSFLPPAS